jgi:pSer/pThr/pTyr-binding forkhead associated (FHA) protein
LTGQRFEVVQPIEAGREVVGITLGFDSQASRRHASFTPTVAGVQMRDLGSTNGTFVNGQRTMSALLNRGDVVQLGNSTFRVE